MKISVIGLGKLGAPMAGIFASKGHFVIAVDSNPERVQAINSRIDPVGENGLGPLLRSPFRANGYDRKIFLEATTDYEKAIALTDTTFIVVATPSEANGRFGLKQVLAACEKIGKAIAKKNSFHIVVLTSTVCPGDTNGRVRECLEKHSGKKAGTEFGLAYNPEFIALGTVIRDFLNPDMVLIGKSDAITGTRLAGFYEHELLENKSRICQMGLTNAEITKLALNTFVTAKISYANMLARICENMPGGDVDVVTSALGLDTRIGTKYLKGGSSFGGPCFPRDNLALMQVARSLGMPDDIPAATHRINETHFARLVQLVEHAAKGKKKIGVLGIAYKPGTAVAECSAGHNLVTTLGNLGYDVCFFDPMYHKDIDGSTRCLNATDCVNAAQVVVLTIPYPEFDVEMCGKTVIDCWRSLRHRSLSCEKYIAVGLGPTE